ncbi:MAG TPA: NADPH-dependent FMN reductase [Alphaproteobacteria bacterium]|jgi:chromate reductase|nr:NADPH-dependent FMN reductase [Alphaproteobacteria bacterium]
MSKPRLLGISGSLRKASGNTAILKALAETLADRASVEIFPLDDIPLYNQDIDVEPLPAAVVALRGAVAAADGVIICSPEYNYGMSGVLKNALDWASRPYGKARLTGKPVLTVTASMASTGGVRAQLQLNETLTAIAALVVLRPQAIIGSVLQKMTDGRFTDETSLKFLNAAVDDLLRDIAKTQAVIKQES